MTEPMEAAACAAALGVSRETSARLAAHLATLQDWQTRMNLVGASTLADPWRRHVLDSGQLMAHLPPPPDGRPRRLVDLGSGAGFPGLVLAILGAGDVHLVESDQKKSAFLRAAAAAAGVSVSVHPVRIETLSPLAADVVTARALAPFARLMPWLARHLAPGGHAVIQKGRDVDRELTDSLRRQMIDSERWPSQSDPGGSILRFRIKAG